MAKQAKVFTCTEDEYRDHDDGCDGICRDCGKWTEGEYEPDREGGTCENCGGVNVCGAGNALIDGTLEIQ